MNNEPLFSIIVPIHNTEKYLDQCIESIVNQTYTNLEIILVDDGSLDSCAARCDLWAMKDKRIRVIHQENKGLSEARNAALRIATGEYIGFVDSDDYVNRDYYEAHLSLIWNTGCEISVVGAMMLWENEDRTEPFTGSYYGVLNRAEAMEGLVSESKLTVPVWNKLYRRDMVEGIEFPAGKHREDMYWTYRVIARANTVAVTDGIGYYYRRRPGGLIKKGISQNSLDELEAMLLRQAFLEQEFPDLVSVGKVTITLSCVYFGRKAQRYLRAGERRGVMKKLRETVRRYRLSRKEYSAADPEDIFWLWLANHFLGPTCFLRNLFRIPMGRFFFNH